MERQVQKPTNTSGELYIWSHVKALGDGSQAQENVGFHLLRVNIALTELWRACHRTRMIQTDRDCGISSPKLNNSFPVQSRVSKKWGKKIWKVQCREPLCHMWHACHVFEGKSDRVGRRFKGHGSATVFTDKSAGTALFFLPYSNLLQALPRCLDLYGFFLSHIYFI